MQVLLAAGADPSPQNNDSQATPLHYATFQGHTTTVQALIDGGADINAQDNQLATPLMMSTQLDDLDIVKILLKAPGINPTIRDYNGFTADKLTKNRKIGALIEAKIAEYEAAAAEESTV